MSRYIDANALKKYVDGCEFCNNCQNKKNRCAFDCVLPDYLTSEWERVINEQPTVDAVPVVRCRECRFYKPWNRDGEYGKCKTGLSVMADMFCSSGSRADGERRTE